MAPIATTVLVSPVLAGAQSLVVESEDVFSVGDIVVISGGGNSETCGIVSFGSILLDAPLEYDYPAGSSITRQDGSSSSSAPAVWEQQDSETSVALIAGAVIIAAIIALSCCGALDEAPWTSCGGRVLPLYPLE